MFSTEHLCSRFFEFAVISFKRARILCVDRFADFVACFTFMSSTCLAGNCNEGVSTGVLGYMLLFYSVFICGKEGLLFDAVVTCILNGMW